MQATDQDFAAVRDEAGRTDPADADYRKLTEDLIARVTALWDRDRVYLASVVPGSPDREAIRNAARTLRMVEQTLSAVLSRAGRSFAVGYTVAGTDKLQACLAEARELSVMPVARRMAAVDPDGRPAEQLAHFIVRNARFTQGRAVITEELAAELPDPYGPVPELAS
ncbi:MAG: hypothetical protein JWO31_1595 [Phycisphaerales bacterium]|nr:hypothetical protein [Phycisphaerales bacterium]